MKMTLEQFIESLIKLGYRYYTVSENVGMNHTRYRKPSREIVIQKFDSNDYYNIYLQIDRKGYSMEMNQHNVTNFNKALNNIIKFERKLAR